MSMLQIEKYLYPSPARIQQRPEDKQGFEDYFIYGNHYSTSEFQEIFPSAYLIGTGVLPGWQWHINDQGNPNVRLVYSRAGVSLLPDQYLIPSPALSFTQDDPTLIRTWGYVFRLPKEDDEKIDKYFKFMKYQRMSQRIHVNRKSSRPGGVARWKLGVQKVILYVDIVNTREGRISIVKDPLEKDKWANGVSELLSMKVPRFFAQKVARKLLGDLIEVEPIFVMPDLEHRTDITQEESHEHEDVHAREKPNELNQQVMAKSRKEELAEENRRRQEDKRRRLKGKVGEKVDVDETRKKQKGNNPGGRKEATAGAGPRTRSQKNALFDSSLKGSASKK